LPLQECRGCQGGLAGPSQPPPHQPSPKVFKQILSETSKAPFENNIFLESPLCKVTGFLPNSIFSEKIQTSIFLVENRYDQPSTVFNNVPLQ